MYRACPFCPLLGACPLSSAARGPGPCVDKVPPSGSQNPTMIGVGVLDAGMPPACRGGERGRTFQGESLGKRPGAAAKGLLIHTGYG